MLRYSVLSFITSMILMACSREPEHQPSASLPVAPAAPVIVDDPRPVILAFGDSLTAGHGVALNESYPSRLQVELDRAGYRYRVVNAGISGDTTSGGLARIDESLKVHPRVVILELGANDGLRGLPIREAKDNLEQMILKCQTSGATVILAGMTLPRNFGPDYIDAFEKMYADLSTKHHTLLIPFFLQNVGAQAELNQEDGIHPTGKGYEIVTQTVLKYLKPVLG